MKKFTAPLRWLWLCAVLAVTGCFHDDDDNTNNTTTTTTVSGTAATGAAMTGTVTAVGANGAQANTTLGTGGAYTLDVNGLTFPLFIRANDGAGTVLYSWADAASDTANITPLTTLALVFSDLSDNLNEVFANWAASSAQLTAATMQAAQAKVNANLQTQFVAKGVDHANYDFLTTAFTANGSGIDGVLDTLDFSFNYLGSNLAGVVTINFAGTTTPLTINIDINTSGISIGGNPGGGTACGSGWCLTVTGTVTTSGIAVSIPATTVSGLAADVVPTASDAGNITQSIQDAYGALGTISNLTWTITSSSATETVARLTFNVTGVVTAAYDLTYTYTLASGGTGGTGGGNTSLTCDTSLFQPGTNLHVPSAAEWATYAKTYLVDEGTFNSNPPPAPSFIKTGNGTLVLGSTYGAVTYNGTNYPLSTACVVVTDSMLYLGFGTGLHIDISNNGTVNGFSPADAMVGIKTP